jgi:HSP20 family protein
MFTVTRARRDPWSMFDELESLREEMDKAFAGWGLDRTRPTRAAGYPPVNVWASKEGLVVDAELPGVDPRNVEITVEGDELTIAGKVEGADASDATWYRRERKAGEFRRVLRLPYRATGADVKATYRNGILRLRVPRPEDEKPRRIAVEAA